MESKFDPLKDKLHFGVYGQKFKTWWYDNDGDEHYHSTIYANLRFYEDGTVIGIRSSVVPKITDPESFTMKGQWALSGNTISFNLEKISDVNDRVNIVISEAESRQMKYYGKIADNNSLIKQGEYTGTIKGNSILIGDFVFTYLDI